MRSLLQSAGSSCLLRPHLLASAVLLPCIAAPFLLQGKPSRSLQAAYKLIAEGGVAPSDVVHLERGVYGWYQASLPMNGEASCRCWCVLLLSMAMHIVWWEAAVLVAVIAVQKQCLWQAAVL